MSRSVLVHGFLALAGLVAAYLVYSGGERRATSATAVEVLSCDGRELQKVALRTANKEVEIVWEGDDRVARVRSSTVRTLPKGATPTAPEVKRFTASDRIARLVQRVAPLRAERSVGVLGQAKRKELRLSDTKDTLAITCGGRTRTWRLGDKTYGGRTRYLQAVEGGEVYLLANGIISDLEMAEFRFMQRDLLSFRLDVVDSVTVKAAGRERKLLHRNRHDRNKSLWVAADAPDQRNELFANWLGKVMRLRAIDYLGRGEQPGQRKDSGASAVVEQVVTLALQGDKVGRAELVKVPKAKKAKKAKGGGGAFAWYARGTATHGWVTVPASLAGQIADDAAQVVGIDNPEGVDVPPAATATGAPAPGQG